MPSRNLEDLHPVVKDRAKRIRSAMFAIGTPILITCTYRSNTEQSKLYEQGRSMPGRIVTNAKPGKSPHNVTRTIAGVVEPSALAFDICFGTPRPGSFGRFSKVTWNGPWDVVATLARHIGLAWGGDWSHAPDMAHFYHPQWRDLAREGGFSC
jgi:peptidoglycan LD-endopeptidase CwlK